MKLCPKCGMKNNNNSSYCLQCGESLERAKKTNNSTNTIWNIDSEIERKGNTRFLIFFLIFSVIFFLMAGFILCWVHFWNGPVEYTVICVDDLGNNLSSRTCSGTIGETIIVEALEIDGYIPKQESLSITLSSRPSDNMLLFVYLENIVAYPDDALAYQGHHYYIFDYDGINWNDAVQRCQEVGGYPAVINNVDENTLLYQYMLKTNHEEAFFGLIMKDDGVWEYPLGDTSDFRDWGINSQGVKEPNNDGGNERNAQLCIHMHDGFWNDAKFGRQSYTPEGIEYKDLYTYICEWDY